MGDFPYQNPSLSPEERAKDLLSRMSQEEKIEQMNCSGCLYSLDEVLEEQSKGKDPVHGEWYWFRSYEPEKLSRMVKNSIALSRFGIPPFVACENIHGAALPFTTIFPSPGCLGASFDPDLAYSISKIQAREIAALGFNKVYAPNLDLFRDPRWGRCEEDLSEDPYTLSKMAEAMVRGIQSEGVMASIKHYLGYSSPESGLNLSPMHMGEREIREYFLPPFEAAIRAGAMGVMTCYNVVDGVPVTIDPLWMRKVLREELGFDGVTILDYGMSGIMKNVMGIGENYESLGKALLEAGVDMEACEPLCYNSAFLSSIEKDSNLLSLVDESVYRILKAKFALGLFDQEPFDPKKTSNIVGNEEALQATYIEEKEGAVLLKNDGVLPLKRGCNVLLLGPNAEKAQLGGITYYAALEDYRCPEAMSEKALTPKKAFEERFGKKHVRCHRGCNFLTLFEEEADAIFRDAAWADVILFAGGQNSVGYSCGDNGGKDHPLIEKDAVTSSEGYDTDSLSLSLAQKRLFARVASMGKKIVFLYYGGKPSSLEDELPSCNALLYCFAPGMRGNSAIADMLLGEFSPSGRLPFSIPRSAGQIPCFYNHYLPKGNYGRPGSLTHPGQDYVFSSPEPLFPFGFGLSYSTIQPLGMEVTKKEEGLEVNLFLRNQGPLKADYVVLLYGRSLENEFVSIQAKRLVRFQRIHLEVGEEKELRFLLKAEDFAYVGLNKKKVIPHGKVEIAFEGLRKEIHL